MLLALVDEEEMVGEGWIEIYRFNRGCRPFDRLRGLGLSLRGAEHLGGDGEGDIFLLLSSFALIGIFYFKNGNFCKKMEIIY